MTKSAAAIQRGISSMYSRTSRLGCPAKPFSLERCSSCLIFSLSFCWWSETEFFLDFFTSTTWGFATATSLVDFATFDAFSNCLTNFLFVFNLISTPRLIKSEISFDEPLNLDSEGNELLLSDVMGTDGDLVYKKIVTYPTEADFLYALADLERKYFYIPEEQYLENKVFEKSVWILGRS